MRKTKKKHNNSKPKQNSNYTKETKKITSHTHTQKIERKIRKSVTVEWTRIRIRISQNVIHLQPSTNKIVRLYGSKCDIWPSNIKLKRLHYLMATFLFGIGINLQWFRQYFNRVHTNKSQCNGELAILGDLFGKRKTARKRERERGKEKERLCITQANCTIREKSDTEKKNHTGKLVINCGPPAIDSCRESVRVDLFVCLFFALIQDNSIYVPNA